MKEIFHTELIGKTIKHFRYVPSKGRLILVLENNNEVLLHTPKYTSYSHELITENNLASKNRKHIHINTLENIYIRDIGWEGAFCFLSVLFILDRDGNIYRFYCDRQFLTDGVCLYDYTEYKNRKTKKTYRKSAGFTFNSGLINGLKSGYTEI